MGVKWIEHKGQRILYVDHRGLTSEGAIENLRSAEQMVAGITGDLRLLTNFEGSVINSQAMQAIKESGKEYIEPIAEKSAVVGIKGIRHVLVQAYNRFTGAGEYQQMFDTEEEALEWLVS